MNRTAGALTILGILWLVGGPEIGADEPRELGDVSDLICYFTSGKRGSVLRIAKPGGGAAIRELPFQNVLALQPSREGCLLVVTFGTAKESGKKERLVKNVQEIDLFGNVLWTLSDLSFEKSDIVCFRFAPFVEPLSNGNVILGFRKDHRVVEVDRQGAVQRELKLDTENLWSVQSTDTGSLLILPKKQPPYEMSWDDRKARRIGPSQEAWKETWLCALKLPDGHYILGGLGAIAEWDREGNLVWKSQESDIGQLHRMGNGNILAGPG